MKWLLLITIRLYKLVISPMLPVACRFHPTCSDYAAQAVCMHGVKRAFPLIIKRLLSCRPGGAHGFDPVPDADTTQGSN